MIALKGVRPDRGPFCTYLRLAKNPISKRDCSCAMRILAELRLADTGFQFPVAVKIVDLAFAMLSQLFVFVYKNMCSKRTLLLFLY